MGFFALSTIDKLSSNKLRDVNDFELYQTIKCYKTTTTEPSLPPTATTTARRSSLGKGTPLLVDKNTPDGAETHSVRIQILDRSLSYQNEFLGCDLGSVVWITSDKAVMNLVQAISERKAACVSSAQASGCGGGNDVIDVSNFEVSFIGVRVLQWSFRQFLLTGTLICRELVYWTFFLKNEF